MTKQEVEDSISKAHRTMGDSELAMREASPSNVVMLDATLHRK